MQLVWEKCGTAWCSLETVDVAALVDIGVYVIWIPSNTPDRPSQVLFVGHGELGACIEMARMNPQIAAHGPALLVTWAVAVPRLAPGIAAYLSKQLQPVSADHWKLIDHYEVNLPLLA